MLKHDFIKDFNFLLNEKEPFAFVRYHDGEHAILEGIPYRAASKWTSLGDDVWFRDELKETLTADLDRFFRGISPPCCTPQAADYYRKHVKDNNGTVTFATLFQFKNFRRMNVLRRKFVNPLIVGSGKSVDIRVPVNGVSKAWDMDAVVDKMIQSKRPIFVAAGPCANVLIYRYWTRQAKDKRQFVLDVGAAFDLEIHGRETREYHKKSSRMHAHICSWDDWKPFTPVTAKQRIEASERTAVQAKFKNFDEGKFNANVVKKNRSEDQRGKDTGNVLVSSRKPTKVVEINPRTKATRTAKNLLK